MPSNKETLNEYVWLVWEAIDNEDANMKIEYLDGVYSTKELAEARVDELEKTKEDRLDRWAFDRKYYVEMMQVLNVPLTKSEQDGVDAAVPAD